MDVWIITAILAAVTVLLITEKIPIDLTAIGIMVALSLSGILSYTEAVAGFANPAVITVGAMFLLSRGMIRTGVVGYIGRKVVELSRGRSGLAMLVVMMIVAAASAFINNTPVVVLFIPVVISMGCRFGVSPSKYLIPLSYASILAGTCTLIGTSTNIIVSDLADQYGVGAIGMFELAKAGVPIAVIGIIFILIAGPRLLPDMSNPACELDGEHQRRYLAEFAVPRGSELVGMNPCADLPERHPGIEVLELIRYRHIYHPCRDDVTIAPDDLLLLKGSPDALVNMIDDALVTLPLAEEGFNYRGPDETVVAELIIPPSSGLIGQKLKETDLRREPDLHIIAIQRSGLYYGEKQLQNIRLRNGDVLLVWRRTEDLSRLRGRTDWIVAEDVHQEIVFRRKAPLTALIFAGMVAAAATGLANIMVCAMSAVFLMVLTGCLPLKEAYKALQSDVLMLIAGTIALGAAMDKTGASKFYADLYLRTLQGASPAMILGGFILLTSVSTQILSNNATAVLLLPIAVSTALNLGVNPKPFIMAVVFGASACFATPIGYQTNLLVYGPGGYRFTDFFKLGLPLNLMVVILGTVLIPVFWPL